MRVPQPDIIEHFGNADAVPQPPERCLSRQAGIVRCCLNEFEQETHAVSDYLTRHKMPVITKEMVYACCDATGIGIDKEYILQFVNAGYNNVLALR